MLRSKTSWVVLALLVASVSTACTRADVVGPSGQSQPSFENTGGNN